MRHEAFTTVSRTQPTISKYLQLSKSLPIQQPPGYGPLHKHPPLASPRATPCLQPFLTDLPLDVFSPSHFPSLNLRPVPLSCAPSSKRPQPHPYEPGPLLSLSFPTPWRALCSPLYAQALESFCPQQEKHFITNKKNIRIAKRQISSHYNNNKKSTS